MILPLLKYMTDKGQVSQMALQIEEVSVARQRVVEAAERLFMERSYNAISLRDIADALGIKQASLYYHFPQGKEEIYVVVAERAFARHAEGMSAAIASAATLPEQLHAVAAWFATQPRMCLMGMIHADLPALHEDPMASVTQAAYLGIFRPLMQAFRQAQERGEIARDFHPALLAGAFLALLDGLSIGEQMAKGQSREEMAEGLIQLFLNGVLPRVQRPRHPATSENGVAAAITSSDIE